MIRQTVARMNGNGGQNERLGSMLLVIAAIIVGLSIGLDGSIARAMNAIGGLAWFAATGFLTIAARARSRASSVWLVAILLTIAVAFVVRPTDLVLATVGFGVAGMAVVSIAPNADLVWAKLVVGLYLPFHIGAAIARSLVRSVTGAEATVRTDPPPTEAIVPIVMVVAAVVGGLIARRFRSGRSTAKAQSVRTAP